MVRIRRGEVPSERLYGMIELAKRGWEVGTCESRFDGWFADKASVLRKYGFNLVNLRSLVAARDVDVLLIKDNFSAMLSAFAFVFRKRIVYLDSLFFLPRHPIRRLLIRINLVLARKIAVYSQYQADLWSKEFGIRRSKFAIVRYSIDVPFYQQGISNAVQRSVVRAGYVLSVGRDLGRDFVTLLDACRQAGLSLKLVTLPYLVPADAHGAEDVEVLQDVSYEELFNLYAGAALAVVPLKQATEYPSGIRAVMESLAVGCPTIATRTPILEEYIRDDRTALLYVDAGDVKGLAAAMRFLVDEPSAREDLARAGARFAEKEFRMEPFVDDLESLIQGSL